MYNIINSTKSIETLAATPEQKSLWVLSQIHPEAGSAYNEVVLINLQGKLDKNILKHALTIVVSRHEVLRTQFSNDGEYIIFVDNLDIQFEILTLKQDNFPKTVETFKNFITKETNKPFPLMKAPLFSFKLFEFGPLENIFFLSIHHTIIDGHSIGIILSELFTVYESIINKNQIIDLAMPVPYSQLVKQRTNRKEDEKNYWYELLKTPPLPLTLKIAKNRPKMKTYCGNNYMFKISKELKTKIMTFSASKNSTVFMTLLATFNILLFCYSQQKDFIIGIPVSTRNSHELQKIVGFATTLFPIRVPIELELTFENYLAKIRKAVFSIHENLNFNTNEVIKKLKLNWNQSRASSLFDVILNMENEQQLPKCSDLSIDVIGLNSPFRYLKLPYFTEKPVYIGSKKSRFDISFHLLNTPEEILGVVSYSTDLFDEDAINRIVQYYQYILEEVINNYNKTLDKFPSLMPIELTQLYSRYF